MEEEQPPHTGLSRQLRSALKEHMGKPSERLFVFPQASDYLIDKLLRKARLSEEQRDHARMLEAHSMRLTEAHAAIKSNLPISMRTARKILQKTLAQLPSYVQRNKAGLDAEAQGQLKGLSTRLREDLEGSRDVPAHLPVRLLPWFIETAVEIHYDELKSVLGEKGFGLYTRAVRRVAKFLLQRGKVLKWMQRKQR